MHAPALLSIDAVPQSIDGATLAANGIKAVRYKGWSCGRCRQCGDNTPTLTLSHAMPLVPDLTRDALSVFE
jgi:hypothetical protein